MSQGPLPSSHCTGSVEAIDGVFGSIQKQMEQEDKNKKGTFHTGKVETLSILWKTMTLT